MGDGECAGDVTRGSRDGVGNEAFCDWKGAAWESAPGALMEPKLMAGRPVWPTGPPFG